MGKYYESGSAEKITVQKNGSFDIVGYGAQGGDASRYNGGKGAEVGGSFILEKGEVLKLFVGQQGGAAEVSGGGGGGTFVLADVNAQGALTPGQYTLLLAAGGGGGARTANGGGGILTPSGSGSGGVGGGEYGAGGGAGFRSNGGSGSSQSGYYYGLGGTAVTAVVNPGAGGHTK